MAVHTSQRGMFAIQNKSCISRVVETRVVPAGWIVTVPTFLAATAVVSIVFLVTSEAGSRRILEGMVSMTVQACRFPVSTEQ